MSKKIVALCTAVASICSLSFAQPSGGETTGAQEVVRARFIHAVPTTPAYNVSHGAESLFQDVEYREITELKTLPQGEGQEREQERRLILAPAGGGEAIQTDRPQAFEDTSEDYTVLASPTKDGSGVEVTVFKVRRPAADEAQAQLTLVNAVPDLSGLGLYIGEQKVHSGVDFQGHAGAEKVDAGSHAIALRTGDNQPVGQPQTVDLAPGRSYTVVAFGTAGNVEAAVVEDTEGSAGQIGSGGTGAAETTGTAGMSGMGTSGAAMGTSGAGTGATGMTTGSESMGASTTPQTMSGSTRTGEQSKTDPETQAMQGLEQATGSPGPGTGPAGGQSGMSAGSSQSGTTSGDQETTPGS